MRICGKGEQRNQTSRPQSTPPCPAQARAGGHRLGIWPMHASMLPLPGEAILVTSGLHAGRGFARLEESVWDRGFMDRPGFKKLIAETHSPDYKYILPAGLPSQK